MRRRKSKSNEIVDPGVLALQLRENMAKTFSDSTISTDDLLDSVYGIPLDGNLPLQYILGVDVLALGRCMSLVGTWGSSKSSLGWYIAKIFLENGGIVTCIDSEHKQNPDQVRAIIDNDELFKRINYAKAYSLDELIKLMFHYCEQYEELVPDKNVPMLLLVDSLNAVTSEEASAKRMKGEDTAGFAGARNAGEIQEAMKSFVPKCLDKNPILAIVINHQKADVGAFTMPGRPAPKKEPGGVHKDFMYTWKLELAKNTTKKSVFGEIPYFTIKAGKSSLGVQHKQGITVPYVGTYDEEGLEHIKYDWDESLALLLTSELISKTELKKVMHLVKSGSKFSSNTLNLKDVSAAEMGAAIHADKELCKELKKNILRVRMKKSFNEILYGEEVTDTKQEEESEE